MQEQKTKLNPANIFAAWIILMIVLTPILMYTSDIGASGGEQKPFTTLATMIATTIIGSAIICLVLPLFFLSWLKKNWWFIILTILTLIPATIFLSSYFGDPYSYNEQFSEVNGDSITFKTEYYDNASRSIRSKSFLRNNKKDSVWTTYSIDGKIIKQLKYRNDTLISK